MQTPITGCDLRVPHGGGRWPAVLLLHGSGGGGPRLAEVAARFAEHGFAALAYTYFVPPAPLAEIDIDRIEATLDWLRLSPFTAGERVGLVGTSRGAELALLLASRIRSADRVAAVAVHAPCSEIRGGFDTTVKRRLPQPAWVSATRPDGLEPRTRIPVEDYEGPLFVAHGTADLVWPDQYSREIEARRRGAGRHVEAHYFEGEGHSFSEAAYDRFVGMRRAFLTEHLFER